MAGMREDACRSVETKRWSVVVQSSHFRPSMTLNGLQLPHAARDPARTTRQALSRQHHARRFVPSRCQRQTAAPAPIAKSPSVYYDTRTLLCGAEAAGFILSNRPMCRRLARPLTASVDYLYAAATERPSFHAAILLPVCKASRIA
jgi:hypothetical protein